MKIISINCNAYFGFIGTKFLDFGNENHRPITRVLEAVIISLILNGLEAFKIRKICTATTELRDLLENSKAALTNLRVFVHD